ncbi:hypothetical protein B0H15DRAFT_839281 [Mycena belliarum]|uniref:Uncharacterized protein n=1 Tax=Mycena belliarum TaxID=1033014 RepID=A0AAD6U9I7_9AGAR|nr:hypothetical protein B0H15DRAFT_839281 [Mycena belliae]
MTVSSYIKRQSRIRTVRKSTLPLTSIVEESVPVLEQDPPHPKRNSEKARRRHGVSNLFIPRNSSLFTAVQGNPADWRLTLDGLDDSDALEFPRPPPFEADDESSGSGSGSESAGCSSAATTPSPSPTKEAHSPQRPLVRCKSIKPLTITKRAVSPVPPPPAPVPSCSSAPSAPSSPCEAPTPEGSWEDDDDFYAAHARSFITLAPPLPPSFPAQHSQRALHRESTIIPARGSVRLSRAIAIPTRAPPPPPIVTSHSRSGSATSINYSLPLPIRPPPRTPVPTDALSGDYADDYAAYLPLLLTPSGSLASSRSQSPLPSPSSSSSSARLAALLSPPRPLFPAEAQGVPADVEEDGWEDADCVWDGGCEYDEVPLSPLVAPAPVSSAPSPVDDTAEEQQEEPQLVPGPIVPPYTGWHPRPPLRQRASQIRRELTATAVSSPPLVAYDEPLQPPTPVLRSRWSSSTLSSVHSAHASVASPKTFAFARRYFKSPTTSSPKHATPRPRVRPMGSVTIANAPIAKSPTPKVKGKKGKKLTVADVNVLVVGRPVEQSVLAGACSSPDVFASPSAFSPVALTPASAGGQWAAYPASVSPSPSHYAPSPSPVHAHSRSADACVSPALYAAYTTQRSPRRRASTASHSSGWSYSSSASPSSAGHSDAGSECSAESGLRRKPIPVGLFLR